MESITSTMRAMGLAPVVLVAVVLSSTPSGADTIDPALTPASRAEMDPLLYNSANWAGYAAETDFSSPVSDSVNAVSGSWTVPKVTRSPNAGGAPWSCCATWVGIDGFDNNTVEQVGTESYILDGTTPVYLAWYEMYPAGMITLTGRAYKVSPGDSITASVQYDQPNCPDQYLLSIADATSGWSFSISKNVFHGVKDVGGMGRGSPNV